MRAPFCIDPNSPEIRTLTNTYQRTGEPQRRAFAMGGGTYARRFANAISYGPGETDQPRPVWAGAPPRCGRGHGNGATVQSAAHLYSCNCTTDEAGALRQRQTGKQGCPVKEARAEGHGERSGKHECGINKFLHNWQKEYREVAFAPVNEEERRALWKALNGLRECRPLIMMDQLPWHELDVDGDLKLRCRDADARIVEDALRKQLYQAKYFPADKVFEPYLELPKTIEGYHHGVVRREVTLAADEKMMW